MAVKIVCKQCGHENEGERIYCHQCGAKLDRTVLAAEKKHEEPPEKARRRVQRLINPARGFFLGWQKALFNSLLAGAIVAACVLASRPPDGIPPEIKKEDLGDAPPIAQMLEDATLQSAPQTVKMSEKVINDYLHNAIKPAAASTFGDFVKFDRAFVNLRDGACRITSEQSVFGYPLYAGTDDKLAIQNGKIVATSVGGNIGRLPLHPLLMEYSDLLFQKLWDSLTRERKLLDQMASISVQKDSIQVVTKGAAPVR